MNTKDLIAHSNSLVESAASTQHKLLRLIDAYHQIWTWLQDHDLHPEGSSIDAHTCPIGFQLIYTFCNDALIPFARLEKEFWQYVNALVPVEDDVRDFLHSEVPEPFASVAIGDDLWDVVVTPHPDVFLGEFPERGFWKYVATAEAASEELHESKLLEQRVNEALAALGSERKSVALSF